MKLSVSNIAWPPEELEAHLALLRDLKCDGVDLAPNIIWPEPVEASASEVQNFRRLCEDHRLAVGAFHALLFTRPDLTLFAPGTARAKLIDYLSRLAELCGALGGRGLVFGSPKNRRRGELPMDQALDVAAGIFRQVGQRAQDAGVWLAIEPLPSQETDFIQTSREGADFVRRADHPGVVLHLDAKAMVEAGEDAAQVLASLGSAIRHFHVGDPGLTPPGSTGLDHAPLGRALRGSGYDGFVAIEMRRGSGPSRAVIGRSVEYVRRCYFDEAAA